MASDVANVVFKKWTCIRFRTSQKAFAVGSANRKNNRAKIRRCPVSDVYQA